MNRTADSLKNIEKGMNVLRGIFGDATAVQLLVGTDEEAESLALKYGVNQQYDIDTKRMYLFQYLYQGGKKYHLPY